MNLHHVKSVIIFSGMVPQRSSPPIAPPRPLHLEVGWEGVDFGLCEPSDVTCSAGSECPVPGIDVMYKSAPCYVEGEILEDAHRKAPLPAS